jgi:hypothetical protein
VISPDVHRPDEAALAAARNLKCASKVDAVKLPLVLLARGRPPALFRPDAFWYNKITVTASVGQAKGRLGRRNDALAVYVVP